MREQKKDPACGVKRQDQQKRAEWVRAYRQSSAEKISKQQCRPCKYGFVGFYLTCLCGLGLFRSQRAGRIKFIVIHLRTPLLIGRIFENVLYAALKCLADGVKG